MTGEAVTAETPAVAPVVTSPVVETPTVVAPKFEQKDNKMFLDGRELSYTSDLIAAKTALEGQVTEAKQALDRSTADNRVAIDKAQGEAAALTGKLREAEEARNTGATTAEEVAKVKTDLEAASSRVGTLETANLELKRQYLMAQFKVPAEKLANTTMVELDALEKALGIVGTPVAGPGNYALGGPGAGGEIPKTPLDRAKQLIANTPIRGVRNPS